MELAAAADLRLHDVTGRVCKVAQRAIPRGSKSTPTHRARLLLRKMLALLPDLASQFATWMMAQPQLSGAASSIDE